MGKIKTREKARKPTFPRFDSCLPDLIFLIFRNTCFSDTILSDPCSERLHFQPKLQKTLVILPKRISSHWYGDHPLSAFRAPAHSLECNGFFPEQPPWVANVCRDQMCGALMKGKRVNIYWEPIESCFLSCCFESLLDLPLSKEFHTEWRLRHRHTEKVGTPHRPPLHVVQVFKTICFGHSYLKNIHKSTMNRDNHTFPPFSFLEQRWSCSWSHGLQGIKTNGLF